jgi:hypothetical protein
VGLYLLWQLSQLNLNEGMVMKINKNTVHCFLCIFLLASCDSSTQSNKVLEKLDASMLSAPITLTAWQRESPDVRVLVEGVTTNVTGNGTQFGYQVGTPPIPVKSNVDSLVKVNYRVENGSICLGVLDQKRNWIKTNDQPGEEIIFNTGENNVVYLILSNCNATPKNLDSIFKISEASIAFKK